MGVDATRRSGRPEHASRAERGQVEECRECGYRDPTVRDLGLAIRYALCDPCFEDLVAARTLGGPLPLSRIIDDLTSGGGDDRPSGT
ncbi:hypothetical protein [Streptomyces sp. NPDC018031]|uniref:hypothetical protein n=1 Tax=Streptomyces sp. NPDC018031 TaxID=3365033 RepID=UPI0037BAE6E9